MQTYFEDMSTRLFSPRVWRGFSAPQSFSPNGSVATGSSGNPAFGFFDDFLTFSETTLVGPYANLVTAAGTLAKVADTAAAKGILSATIVGDTAEDENVLKWGSTLSAPFLLADNDLAFEACLSMSAVTAAKWNIAVGLGQADMITTDLMFTDADILADKNFCGFVKLVGEAGVFDGAYKADGQTYQDGATKTKLNALATFTASATTYVKLGMRYRAHPKTLEWYVNGAALGNIAPSRLTATEVDAATFPDDVQLAPFIGIKDGAGDTALNVQVDWWACAQNE
jgi:hypothetical protein